MSVVLVACFTSGGLAAGSRRSTLATVGIVNAAILVKLPWLLAVLGHPPWPELAPLHQPASPHSTSDIQSCNTTFTKPIWENNFVDAEGQRDRRCKPHGKPCCVQSAIKRLVLPHILGTFLALAGYQLHPRDPSPDAVHRSTCNHVLCVFQSTWLQHWVLFSHHRSPPLAPTPHRQSASPSQRSRR